MAAAFNISAFNDRLFGQDPFNLTKSCLQTFSDHTSSDYLYDPSTFWSCLSLNNVTAAISNGTVPKATLSKYAKYGIVSGSGSKDLWMDIVERTTSFFSDACALSNCLDVNKNSTCASLNITATTLNQAAIASCKENICMGLTKGVQDDPDIGGIGVFISYAIQILMVLLVALHVAHRYLLRMASRRSPSHPPVPLASAAFNDACLNFHKTQCWFVATIVTAAFIRRATDNVSLIDTSLLLSVTLSGMTLVTFTLMALYYLDRGMNGEGARSSWYVYTLSFVAFALCAVFMAISLKSRDLSAREWGNARSLCVAEFNEIPERNLIITYVTTNATIHRRLYVISLLFCGVVMAGLFVRQSEEFWSSLKSWSAWRVLRIIVTVVVLAMYGALFFFVVFGLNLFRSLVNTSAWGFGQIIALFIWIPIILDYLHDRWRENNPKNVSNAGEVMEMKQSSPPSSPPIHKRSGYDDVDIGPSHSRQGSDTQPMLQAQRGDGYSRLHSRSQSDVDDRLIHRARTDFV